MRRIDCRQSVLIWSLVLLAVAAVRPYQLLGQAVRGTIRDSVTSQTVPNARVTLLGLYGDTVATTTSGNDGSFLIEAPSWGRYILSTVRLGYGPVTEPDLKLLPEDTLQLHLWMSPLAVALDPVVVRAEAAVQYAHARYLQNEGFYHRERSTVGRFLDPATIERRRGSALYISDYLSHLPGTRFNRRRQLSLRCGTPKYFIDGAPVLMSGPLEMAILPYDVLAIEVYSGPAQTPNQYGGKCAVVIWTRHRAEARGR